MPSESFEQLIASMPPEVRVSDVERGELTILARSADREAARAQTGEETHELGVTMARFLVRFAEMSSVGAPDKSGQLIGEIRQTLAEADAAMVERFRVDTA